MIGSIDHINARIELGEAGLKYSVLGPVTDDRSRST